MDAELVEVDGNRRRTICLDSDGEKMIMGIGSTADICTSAEKNSDLEHAILKLIDEKWFIMDTFSITGVFVNGTKVKPFEDIPLEDGCQISLAPPLSSNIVYEFHCKPSSRAKKSRKSNSEASTSKKGKDSSPKVKDVSQCDPKAVEWSEEDEKSLHLPLRARVALRLGKLASLNASENDDQDEDIDDTSDTSLEQKRTRKHSLSDLCEYDDETKSVIVAIPKKRLLELEKCERKCIALKKQLVEQKSLLKERLETDLSCPICFEVFNKTVTIPCGHSFCQKCLASWTEQGRKCPLCRSSFTHSFNSIVADKIITALSQFTDKDK